MNRVCLRGKYMIVCLEMQCLFTKNNRGLFNNKRNVHFIVYNINELKFMLPEIN